MNPTWLDEGDPEPLHSGLASFLGAHNRLVEQAVRDGVVATPESARAALAGLTAFEAPPRPMRRVTDRDLATTAGPVAVREYEPDGAAGVPVVFLHGGGPMAGDLDVYDRQARRVAAASGSTVVSVGYRLAPEHPYPAGLDDVTAVMDAVADGGRVNAVGDSGGAALLASVGMRTAEQGGVCPIARQVLWYPSLDYTLAGESVERFGRGYFLTAARMRWYFDHYFAGAEDRDAASPASGPFRSDLPETLVIAADHDPLLSDARRYVERMRDAGAVAHLRVAPGSVHAFSFFETVAPELTARLDELTGAFLRNGSAAVTP